MLKRRRKENFTNSNWELVALFKPKGLLFKQIHFLAPHVISGILEDGTKVEGGFEPGSDLVVFFEPESMLENKIDRLTSFKLVYPLNGTRKIIFDNKKDFYLNDADAYSQCTPNKGSSVVLSFNSLEEGQQAMDILKNSSEEEIEDLFRSNQGEKDSE